MNKNDKIIEFAKLIKESKSIIFFGGAGVSTESGLKDYRSADGIYNTARNYGLPPEELLSHSCIEENPELFYRFYRDYFICNVKPNAAHLALARLEQAGKSVCVVTQNIDGLHQKAGSKKVYELHGSALRYYCMNCKKKFDVDYIVKSSTNIPLCSACSGLVRPDVTLYGEMLDEKVISQAVNAISNAEMMIIAGTSLAVYPAASFVRYFNGDKLVIINKDKTDYDTSADLVFNDRVGEILSQTVKII